MVNPDTREFVDGEHRIPLGGVEHWVRVAGAGLPGTPLVLVHGGPGANASMLEQSVGPHLAKQVPVIYYDQRGCGRSGPSPADGYRVGRLVADLDELRRAFGLARWRVAGFSFGGVIAGEYAVALGGHVERLVLVAPAIYGPLRHEGRMAGLDAVLHDDNVRARVRAETLAADLRPGGRIPARLRQIWRTAGEDALARFGLYDPHAPRPEPLPAELGVNSNPDFAEAVMNETRPGNLLDDLAGVTIPTLVVVGLYDRHVGVDTCRDVADRMPDARLALMDRSGHAPYEQPEEYARAITDFLLTGFSAHP